MDEVPGRPAFLDTNILVYALLEGEPWKRNVATALLARGGTISVQVPNEFASVALRKLRRSLDDVEGALSSILTLMPDPVPVTLAAHRTAMAFVRRHGFALYDALLVASALEAGCTTFLSEDMHDGLVVSDRLMIRNPFRPAREI